MPAPPPTPADRVRQHLARRPSPYLPALAERLAAIDEPPAFVQVEHAMAGYYLDRLGRVPVILSTQNVDSQMLATVARGHRTLSPAWLAEWNRSLSTGTTERRVARRADTVLCVSDHDVAHFAGLGAATLLVPNGVDEDLFSIGPPAGRARVLFFGRLDYAPNDHGLRRFLAEVWPAVAAARPDATLRVVGAGLGEQAAAATSQAPRAEAVGLVPDIRAELAACDVVAVPIWQGGGTRLKVLEALGAGRVVAGTPLGVSGLGVRGGEHAAVAEQPAELAAAMVGLLADQGAARELAAAGRRLAEAFRWSTVTAPAERLYASLLPRGV